MMAVRIDTTDGFAAETAVRLFEDRYVTRAAAANFADQYAVAPDGRFLMMKELPRPAELIVVRNWAEELKQLIGEGGMGQPGNGCLSRGTPRSGRPL